MHMKNNLDIRFFQILIQIKQRQATGGLSFKQFSDYGGYFKTLLVSD